MLKKMHHSFHKNIKQNIKTDFNIDNSKFFLSSKSEYFEWFSQE